MCKDLLASVDGGQVAQRWHGTAHRERHASLAGASTRTRKALKSRSLANDPISLHEGVRIHGKTISRASHGSRMCSGPGPAWRLKPPDGMSLRTVRTPRFILRGPTI